MSTADGRRPGGLTALAVLNFVFGGFGVINVLGTLPHLGSGGSYTVDLPSGAITVQMDTMWYVAFVLNAVTSFLLIASGIGYLGQKRFLGRTLGSVYAVLNLIAIALTMSSMPTGFGIFVLIGLIYPVLTLILVNTTFKDDLVN